VVRDPRNVGNPGKNEQPDQTPWRGAPWGAGPNAAASVASVHGRPCLYQICFIVTLLINCLDKRLIAYKILSKYFIQVLPFVPLVHITQTATRVGSTYTLNLQNYLQNFPTSASQLKFDVKINSGTDNWRGLKKAQRTWHWNFCQSKKSIILTPCTSTQGKLENEQRKNYRILISSCWPTDIRLFDFYRKRWLRPNQSHYNQLRLWSRLYTGPNYTDHSQVNIHWIHCINVQDFWATLRLPWKTEFALKFFTTLNIFFTERIFEQKAKCALNSLYWMYIFIVQDFWTTCACPESFQAGGAAGPRRTPMQQSAACPSYKWNLRLEARSWAPKESWAFNGTYRCRYKIQSQMKLINLKNWYRTSQSGQPMGILS